MIILRGQAKSQGSSACSPRGEAGRQAGQALIEALLALAFAVVIITAVVIAVINALNNTAFNKNQNLASQYAQEGLDIARNLKDSNYDSFKSLSGVYCLDPETSSIETVGSCSEPDDFERKIYINHSGTDEAATPKCQADLSFVSSFVSSIVFWTDSKCSDGSNCHKVQLESCFSDPNRQFGT